MIELSLVGLVVAVMVMLGTWLVSVHRDDVSVVDPVWGLVFVAMTAAYLVGGHGDALRAGVTAALATAWGLRLFTHLTLRKRGATEDARYRAMRERHPLTFRVRSLVTVFMLQAVLAWVVAMPLLTAIADASPPAVTGWDAVGVALVVGGLAFETVADLQLTRFRADPSHRGMVMDRGLWRFSRHPNYFGECVVWWGFGLLGLATGAWWSLVSPVVMTVMLTRVSGVGMLERHMSSRPGYDDYVRRTNAFLPGPPRSG